MHPKRPFTPAAWIWRDDHGVIYSSGDNALVSSSDAVYLAWTADGSIPTVWPHDDSGNQTAASLNAVLAAYGLPAYVVT